MPKTLLEGQSYLAFRSASHLMHANSLMDSHFKHGPKTVGGTSQLRLVSMLRRLGLEIKIINLNINTCNNCLIFVGFALEMRYECYVFIVD